MYKNQEIQVIIFWEFGFKKNLAIPFCHIIDIAPTFARILEQNMPQTEGRVLSELLV